MTVSIRRREVLVAAGTAGTMALVDPNRGSTRGSGSDATVAVRVYPGPVPAWVWTRYGFAGFRSGWPPPHRAARSAVESTLERIGARLSGTTVSVTDGTPLESDDVDVGTLPPSRADLLDAFQDAVRERGVDAARTCHLLLWWGPLDSQVGYGGARGHVAAAETHVVCNVGATEVWDDRSVTRNMAIHETLHAFLTEAVTETVTGTTCDHDLGTVERLDDSAIRVTPLATAYATPQRIGVGTRWPGSGCVDRARYDELFEDGTIERVTYTETLSEETHAAVAAYVDRSL